MQSDSREGLAVHSVRYHYMDNLRALAMLLGVFFHAALAYSNVVQNLWFTASPENSTTLSFLAWFTHLFRMPLFFLIAGFFASYLVRKRGVKGFIANRGLRVLLPFLIFLPLLTLSFVSIFTWAFMHVQALPPILVLFQESLANPGPETRPVSTAHLWFLYYLFMFCLIFVAIYKYIDKNSVFSRLFTRNFILFAFPLLLIPSLISQTAPHPAPERIYPQLWSFGYYGMFFLLGAVIFSQQQLLDALARWCVPMLLIGVGFYFVIYSFIPDQMSRADAGLSFSDRLTWPHIFVSSLEAFVSTYMTLLCLLVGRLFLDKKNAMLRFISDSSYWLYIIHLPILFFIQLFLLNLSLGVWIQFWLSSVGTILFGFITYWALVRWSPIGWLLNGRKKLQVSS